MMIKGQPFNKLDNWKFFIHTYVNEDLKLSITLQTYVLGSIRVKNFLSLHHFEEFSLASRWSFFATENHRKSLWNRISGAIKRFVVKAILQRPLNLQQSMSQFCRENNSCVILKAFSYHIPHWSCMQQNQRKICQINHF